MPSYLQLQVPHIQGKSNTFQSPSVSTILTEQHKIFQANSDKQNSLADGIYYPQVMTVDHQTNIVELEKLINGKAIDLTASMWAIIQSQKISCDFGNQGNIIPVHAEFDEPSNPKDFDTYQGGTLHF